MNRCLALALCALLPVTAQAGELADAAAAVESAVTANDFAAWQSAAAALETKLWFSAGLHFGTLTLVSAQSTGYGVYQSRADNVYAQGEPILIYAEPKGYGYGDAGNGMYEIAFDIDLIVKDTASGEVLLESPSLMQIAYQAMVPAREFVANLNYTLGTAPPGSYTLETVFHDRHGGQQASFTSDIVIR